MVGPQRRRHRLGRLPGVAGYARDAPAGPAGHRARTRRAAGADHRARRRAAHAAAPEGDRRGRARAARARVAATPTSPSTPTTPERAARAQLLLDLLTPSPRASRPRRASRPTRSRVQIHGGYGYSSEYLPEAWLRDQKLNTHPRGHHRHPGPGPARPQGRWPAAARRCGARRRGRARTVRARPRRPASTRRGSRAVERALGAIAGADRWSSARAAWPATSRRCCATARTTWSCSRPSSSRGSGSSWRRPRAGARRRRRDGFYQGKLAAAQYWFATELPRIDHLAALCRSGEDSYLALDPDWL